MSKFRPAGRVMLDMEPLLEELVDNHEFQHAEIIGLIVSWLKVHRPDDQEEYEDGSHAEIKYRS